MKILNTNMFIYNVMITITYLILLPTLEIKRLIFDLKVHQFKAQFYLFKSRLHYLHFEGIFSGFPEATTEQMYIRHLRENKASLL